MRDDQFHDFRVWIASGYWLPIGDVLFPFVHTKKKQAPPHAGAPNVDLSKKPHDR